MYKWNDGTKAADVLQNQFTAYVTKSIRNGKLQYLIKQRRSNQTEASFEEYEYLLMEKHDDINRLIEHEALTQALRCIHGRERFVLFARVIEEKSFSEIADELGMSYKGAAAIYYRVIEKLRLLLNGGDKDGF